MPIQFGDQSMPHSIPLFLKHRSVSEAPVKKGDFFQVNESENTNAYLQLWIFRVLFDAKQWSTFTKRDCFSDDELAVFLGLDKYLDFNDKDLLPTIKKECIQNYELLLKNNDFSCALPHVLSENLRPISDLLGLNEVERTVLGFVILYQQSHLLDAAFDLFDNLSIKKVLNLLSLVLHIPVETIKSVFLPNSTLMKTSLLKLDLRASNSNHFGHFFDFFDNNIGGKIYNGMTDPMDIFHSEIKVSEASQLRLSDFQHLQEEVNMLKLLLINAVKNKTPGVNVFIYGQPGTGKTQLVRLIAKLIKCELFEVSANVDGRSMSANHRLDSYTAAQHLLKNKKSLLLFDEVEDVFNQPSFSSHNRIMSKAWMNNALESNIIPTIWVSNSQKIDPAYLRRYSLVLHLDTPPYEKRMKLLKKVTQKLVGKSVLDKMTKSEYITPAIASNTAMTIQMMLSESGETYSRQKKEQLFISILNQTLKATGNPELQATETKADKGLQYDPRYLNSSIDLSRLVERLEVSPNARLCFYGPPGTGKTQFGHYLAESLNMPLVQKKGSDLLGMYVGQTEKQIAAAFAEAKKSNAMLMIDEADSFLRSRAEASRRWEQSMVNEMLVQMEQFQGIFIASTNLLEILDEASMRRFDAKIKFDYMSPKTAIEMLDAFCVTHKLVLSDVQRECAQVQFNYLTPGDFAMLGRQQRFSPCKDSQELIDRLIKEQQFKADVKTNKSIGFVV